MKKHCTFVVPRHVTVLVLMVCMGHMILLITWATNSVILDTNISVDNLQRIEGIWNDESPDGSVERSEDKEFRDLELNQIKYSQDDQSSKKKLIRDSLKDSKSAKQQQYKNGLASNVRLSKHIHISEEGLLTRKNGDNRRALPQQAIMSPGQLSYEYQRVKANETSEHIDSSKTETVLWGVKSQGGGHQVVVRPQSNRSKRVTLKRPISAVLPTEPLGEYRGSRRRGLSYPDDTASPRGIKAPLRHTNMSSVQQADEMAFSSETNGSKTRSHSQGEKLDTPAKPFIRDIGRSNRMKEMPREPLPYSDQALRAFYSDKKDDKRINFQYSITPQFLCEASEDSPNGVDMVTVVHSHPTNKAQRDAIRNTWGRAGRDYDLLNQIRLVFVLGMTDSVKQEDLIIHEANIYNDLLMGLFKESYENLSVKSLYAINWVAHNCLSASYMLKTDDDTYLHLPSLMQHLKAQNKSGANHITAMGAVNSKSPVLRSGLWQVSMTSFPFAYYPQYCTGCAYILSTSILQQLLAVAHRVALIPVEDAYITGILVTLIGHKCINLEQLPQWFMGPSHTNICKLIKGTLLGLHNVPYETMYTVYQKISSRNYTRCLS